MSSDSPNCCGLTSNSPPYSISLETISDLTTNNFISSNFLNVVGNGLFNFKTNKVLLTSSSGKKLSSK